jgi:hypothetical protein
VLRGEQSGYRHLVFQFTFDNQPVDIAEVDLGDDDVLAVVRGQGVKLQFRR